MITFIFSKSFKHFCKHYLVTDPLVLWCLPSSNDLMLRCVFTPRFQDWPSSSTNLVSIITLKILRICDEINAAFFGKIIGYFTYLMCSWNIKWQQKLCWKKVIVRFHTLFHVLVAVWQLFIALDHFGRRILQLGS